MLITFLPTPFLFPGIQSGNIIELNRSKGHLLGGTGLLHIHHSLPKVW